MTKNERAHELPVPVLEIGGTHVTAALVELFEADANVPFSIRRPLDADGSAPDILDAVAAAAREVGDLPGAHWGVATPGPFDYATGVARFTGVGKFDALNGVDVASGLTERVATPGGLVPVFSFLNDAAAFAIGEWFAGAARGASKVVCITLGTGTGAAFLVDGRAVTSGVGVPPEGVVHLLTHEGRDLEEHVSRRALIRAYAEASGVTTDVHHIAAAALADDEAALAVFERYYAVLATVLAPWLESFGADMLVVGGSIARSWALVERYLVPQVSVPVRPAELPEAAPLVGAAVLVARTRA